MAKPKTKQNQTIDEIENEQVALFESEPELQDEHSRKQTQRAEALKAINAMEIPRARSRELIGKEFSIVDAYSTMIKDDECICFIVEYDGKQMQVAKSLNAFNQKFLDYFQSFGDNEKSEPLTGYTFVEATDLPQTAGNHPVILRKL